MPLEPSPVSPVSPVYRKLKASDILTFQVCELILIILPEAVEICLIVGDIDGRRKERT